MTKLKMNKWIFAGAVLVLILAGMGGWYLWGMPQASAEEMPLQTAKARAGDISVTVSGAGNLVSASRLELGFRTAGTVASVQTSVGEDVAEGQVLVRLDDSAARLQLAARELELDSLISTDALNEAEIARLNAEEDLRLAITNLQYLISPAVYNAEIALEKAQAALDEKKAANASAADITAAEKTVGIAKTALDAALIVYKADYSPLYFIYSYQDPDTLETVETILPPSEQDISLARANVRTAELAIEDAKMYFERLTAEDTCVDLTAVGALTSKLVQACLNVKSAQLTVDGASLVSPVQGQVTSMDVAVGQSVGTTPVVSIAAREMYMHFYVEEADMRLIKIGLPVNVIFEAYPDQVFAGVIERIDPELALVDGASAVSIWATMAGEDVSGFLSGMTAEVEVVAGESKDTVLVPVQAVRELAAGSYAVFIVGADGSLKLTPVETGLRDLANVEILSGITAGDVVSTGIVETK